MSIPEPMAVVSRDLAPADHLNAPVRAVDRDVSNYRGVAEADDKQRQKKRPHPVDQYVHPVVDCLRHQVESARGHVALRNVAASKTEQKKKIRRLPKFPTRRSLGTKRHKIVISFSVESGVQDNPIQAITENSRMKHIQ